MAEFDILIVGGGIHGCGIAQAAAAQGYRTLLIEQGALADGTSSRSSKLIHGGLRYLETLQLPLVYEALHERTVLLRIAPHLVRKERFYIPVYDGNLRPPWMIGAGLSLYALLSLGESAFHRLPRKDWADALPDLSREGLRAVFQYWDGTTDDARLTRAVAASGRQLGAEIREGVALLYARREHDCWTAELNRGETVRARLLVNASGPWVEDVQRRIEPAMPLPPLDRVQGAHIVLPQPQEAFVYVEAEQHRAMFIMPWQGRTMIGTTETAFTGDPAEVYPTPDEINRLCETYHRYYPGRSWQADAIVERFAGVRVLPKAQGTFTGRSRSTLLAADRLAQPSLIAVCGGKLTTYRRTAEKVLRLLNRSLPPPERRIDTSKLTLPKSLL
jgi:glycerol-3-phosphate dehydrogenase